MEDLTLKSEILEKTSNSNSSKKIKNKFSFEKSVILKIIFVILALTLSFFAQKFYYKPNFGTIIDSDMDSLGNVYILSVVEKSNQYKVTKISEKGKILFERKLDKPTKNEFFKYKHLEVDSKGYFFVVKEVRNLDAIVANPSQYPIAQETVRMFDEKGKDIKQVALFDFAAASQSPTSEYVKKIQIVNQKLSIICFRDNIVEIVGVNPYLDQSPEKEFSFSVTPPNTTDSTWINDFSVISNGNVVYATKSGNLCIASQDGTTTECNSLVPNEENSISLMSVDRLDNIYFTDLRTGTFYKFDTNTMSVTSLYSIDDKIKIENLTVKDFRKIRAINENDFFAASKTFVDPFFARFGNNSSLISNIGYKYFYWGLVFTILGALLLILLSFFIHQFIKIGIKRTYFSIKITLLFLPIFIILMSCVLIFSTNKSMANYTKVLRQNQSIGAKIVSEKIDGDNISKMIANSNYMSSDFISTKNAIKNAYIDLKDKVDDTSDYIVIYVLDNNKIYSVMDNKYSGDSKYYEKLKFADPDMTQDKVAIVDSLLEKDEIEEIYSTWSKIKDQQKSSVLSMFRDIHGNLSATFVPIKNGSGTIVGMVGNFLDEESHVNSKKIDILKESSILIGITSIAVFLYLCLIVWILLKPMRILEHGIEVMINGHWKNRLPITSRDEFASISIAFNNMSNKLEEYTYNLKDLNSEYIRYVPKELLNLAGKDKITQTSVGNGKSSNVFIIYITFNVKSLDDENDTEHGLFSKMQDAYSKIFDIVDSNDGIVQNFSSLGATLLFKNSQLAFTSSLQISESDIHNIIKKNMRISIGSGSSFVGILGNDMRRGVSMASKEMLRLVKIDNGIEKLGINFAITESAAAKMDKDFSLSMRFVGKFKDISGLTWVKMYEVIDISDNFKREMNIRTKSLFERAVQLYIDGDIEESRNLFVEVLHKNKSDKTSLYYINMCNFRLSFKGEDDDLNKFVGEILGN